VRDLAGREIEIAPIGAILDVDHVCLLRHATAPRAISFDGRATHFPELCRKKISGPVVAEERGYSLSAAPPASLAGTNFSRGKQLAGSLCIG
jgi:hypothetical protein